MGKQYILPELTENTMEDSFRSLLELLDNFKEEHTCHAFLAAKIWDNGKPICPHCNSVQIYTTKSRSFLATKKDIPEYRCKQKTCGKKFSVTTGTVMHSTKIPLRYWFGAMYLLTSSKKGVSSVLIAKQLNITQKSAWHLLHRIREMYKETAPEKLKGVVAVDETFVGGKNKNRHKNKKVKKLPGGGRDWKDKTSVVGLVEKGGTVRTFVTGDTSRQTLQSIIYCNVQKGSTVVTDDYVSYYGIAKDYWHTRVKHYVWYGSDNKSYHTNSIEGFWSILKRGMIGIYNYVRPKHLFRYCNEFTYRYNFRNVSPTLLFEMTLKKAINRRLTYKTLKLLAADAMFIAEDSDHLKNEYEYLDKILPNDTPNSDDWLDNLDPNDPMIPILL